MPNTWTPERRAMQAIRIRVSRPWERSTGPRTTAGKQRVAKNAYKGGRWLKLKELSKALNAALRDHRQQLERLMP